MINKIKNLITELKNGADFATLAKDNSEDGTASNGGLFENFEKENTDQAFWKASYELANDTYTETPVESQFGYHIILRVSKTDKEALENIKNATLEELESTKGIPKTVAKNIYNAYHQEV